MARGASYERLADGLDEHENEQRYRDEDEDDDSTLVPKKSVKAKAALKGLVGPYGKPTTYYGEGSFDAPSSDEEEKDEDGEGETGRLINKPPGSPGLAERGGAGEPKKPRSVRYLVILIATLVGVSAIIGIIAANSYVGIPYRVPGSKKVTMDHIFNGTFSAEGRSLHWVSEAGDGVFSIIEGTHIQLVDLKTNTTKSLVNLMDIKDSKGNQLHFGPWFLSPDMKYILVKSDQRKQWRWSNFGNYYIHDIESKTTRALVEPTIPAKTAYATWSPTGQSIAYVLDNDLYVLPTTDPSTSAIRITSTGNASLFHGVPDWVYEEEIFSADFALWWAPDSTKLAYLSFDETSVDEFSFPVYNPTEDSNAVVPYTSDVVMKYPKPGYDNPLVSVHLFDLGAYLGDEAFITGERPVEEAIVELDWEGRKNEADSVVMEVKWVDRERLMLKEVNRNADDGSVVLFDLAEQGRQHVGRGKVVRRLGKQGEEGDDGWIENTQTIYPLPASLSAPLSPPSDSSSGGGGGYLDIVPTKDGYNHIALFAPADAKTPVFLTAGAWEVTQLYAVDTHSGLVYFQATTPTSSIERHIYSVAIPQTPVSSSSSSADGEQGEKAIGEDDPKPLTDALKGGFYSASFSPEAGFHVLSYQGPGIPWQKVVKSGDEAFDYVLTTNERLANITQEFEAAAVSYQTIESDGYELNAKEMRPPNMDDSGRTKYPVLFQVYGGPGAQEVDTRFRRNWLEHIVCNLQYVVVIVDGRGTGFKGRKLRNTVKGNLGFFETVDQLNAARIWAAKEYVDPKRIGIWGWSYGGFMSSKVVEADAGIHSLAMAVAPVTSWRLYDSIYTERYMNLPDRNPGGYVNASISSVEGFRHVDFLLAHGSADDNVHYANSAHLLDMFTRAQIRNFRFRMFTDSDHGINRRGANREVYEYMSNFLVEKWGKGGRRRGW